MNDIPEWACEKAAALTYNDPDDFTLGTIKMTAIGRAFATYIAELEQPPVDPDVAIAQEWAGKWRGDNNMILEDAILAAIKASKA